MSSQSIFRNKYITLGLSDTDISVADAGVPNDQVASRDANNASTTATITVTMYAVADD